MFNAFLLAVNFPISARKSLSHDSLACLDFNAVIVCFILSLIHGMFHFEHQTERNVRQLVEGMLKRFNANYSNLQMVSVMKGHNSALKQPAVFRHVLK